MTRFLPCTFLAEAKFPEAALVAVGAWQQLLPYPWQPDQGKQTVSQTGASTTFLDLPMLTSDLQLTLAFP